MGLSGLVFYSKLLSSYQLPHKALNRENKSLVHISVFKWH